MQLRSSIRLVFSLLAIPLLSGFLIAANQEKVIHVFSSGSADGISPNGGLIADSRGDLYGTTYEGGTYNYGAVFELIRGANGAWSENILYNFNNNGSDGFYPAASLIPDTKGNLYGTTWAGGTSTSCPGGCGTAFELSSKAGTWSETILHSFDNNGTDGAGPLSSLTFDTAGNLYGATSEGGQFGQGSLFELALNANGTASETVIHSFNSNGVDGVAPRSGLVFDAAGNLYGATLGGGQHDWGTVFQLTRGSNGQWNETILHSFDADGTDGGTPFGTPALDGNGNLYGTTYQGGTGSSCSDSYGCGIAFELMRSSNGTWSEQILHNFGSTASDGANLYAGLVLGGSGNLYGTTYQGGAFRTCSGFDGCGTAFVLLRVNRAWEETVLHNFSSDGEDGFSPNYGNLTLDSNGNLFGMTFWGTGVYITDCSENCGTVFQIKVGCPPPHFICGKQPVGDSEVFHTNIFAHRDDSKPKISALTY